MEFQLDKAHLLYPDDFTFKEKVGINNKENSNINLNQSDEYEKNKVEKSKKYNIEKMNLNNDVKK